MSSASKSVTINFTTKMGTCTPMIQSPSGDLYQEYQRVNDQVTVTPDFSQSKPLLIFVCTSSRVSEGLITPSSMRYFFGDTEIEFDANGKSIKTLAGLFEIVRPGVNQLHWGLRIVNNIAEAAGFSPATIKMIGKISFRKDSTELTDDVQALYTIPVGPYTGTSYRVTIKAQDGGKGDFTLTSATDSRVLEAKVIQGNETVTKDLYYKWYGAAPTESGWQLVASGDSKTYTVKASEVDCTREYMVEVYNDKAMGKDHLLGYDFQTVMDASDPYDIDPCPKPADMTIDEDETGNGSVTFTPKLVVRGSTTPIDTKFKFTLKSASGVVLNTEASRKPTVEASTFTVTRQDCCNGGYSEVALTINSVK